MVHRGATPTSHGGERADRPRPTLGDFTLLAVIGRGGSGVVYEAMSAGNARPRRVALKVLRADRALSDRERRRFFAEVERMRAVRHDALVELLDAGVLPDGRPYLTMPLLAGETVASRVARGPLSPSEAVAYLEALGGGVEALHRAGLVHRDIKPENVLLEAGRVGRAVLLDFGIAREIDGPATTTTRVGRLRGTPAYMAPERFFGAPAGVLTDVYELAVVAYVMLVGSVPWDADSADARLNPKSPAERGTDLPPALAAVVMRALSTRPEVRPAGAEAFARQAREALGRGERARAGVATTELGIRDRPASAPAAEERRRGDLVVGRYRLDERIGGGGMSEVWAATHTLTEKAVALKFLRPELAREQAYRRRFVREARAASLVRHPNVVQIHDVLELEGGAPVLVMDRLRGESLGARLAREGALSLPETARVLLPVLAAVDAAHARGVVHRDLKPDNVFLASEGRATRVTVLDFGVAKLTGADRVATAATLDGALLGTPLYMAPEQLCGEADVDGRCDVWALGVILYECLSGRRPIQADNVGQVMRLTLEGAIEPLDRRVRGLPPRLVALVRAMLSRRRDHRPASLAAIYRELAAHRDPALDGLPEALAPAAGDGSTPVGGGVAILQSDASALRARRSRAPRAPFMAACLVLGCVAAALVAPSWRTVGPAHALPAGHAGPASVATALAATARASKDLGADALLAPPAPSASPSPPPSSPSPLAVERAASLPVGAADSTVAAPHGRPAPNKRIRRQPVEASPAAPAAPAERGSPSSEDSWLDRR